MDVAEVAAGVAVVAAVSTEAVLAVGGVLTVALAALAWALLLAALCYGAPLAAGMVGRYPTASLVCYLLPSAVTVEASAAAVYPLPFLVAAGSCFAGL